MFKQLIPSCLLNFEHEISTLQPSTLSRFCRLGNSATVKWARSRTQSITQLWTAYISQVTPHTTCWIKAEWARSGTMQV